MLKKLETRESVEVQKMGNRLAWQMKESRKSGFKTLIEDSRDSAVELFFNEMLARINIAHDSRLMGTAFAMGRVAKILEDFCESLEEGNHMFAMGYQLEPEETAEELDLVLGVFGEPADEVVNRYTNEESEPAVATEPKDPIPALVASTMSDFFEKVSKLDVDSPYRIGCVARQMRFICKDLCEPFINDSDAQLFDRAMNGDFNEPEFSALLDED